MATTYTSLWRLAILQPADPGTQNSWGAIQDATMPLMEQGAVGITQVSIGGLTTYSLTTADNASDQARYLVQQYVGALSATCTVTLPNLAKVGWARNSTTGAQNVVLTSGGGTTATIPPDGNQYFFFTDGTGNTALVNIGNAVNVPGNLQINGSLTVQSGVVFNAAGAGAFEVPNGESSFNYIQTTNGLTTSGSGWALTPTGPASFNGAISIGISCNNGFGVLASNFFAVSDARLKSEVHALSPLDGKDFVKSARPVSYLKGKNAEAGFLAQDQVRSGYHKYVGAIPRKGLPERVDDDGFRSMADMELSLNYNNYIAYLTASQQGLYDENESLRTAVGSLVSRIEALEGAR